MAFVGGHWLSFVILGGGREASDKPRSLSLCLGAAGQWAPLGDDVGRALSTKGRGSLEREMSGWSGLVP